MLSNLFIFNLISSFSVTLNILIYNVHNFWSLKHVSSKLSLSYLLIEDCIFWNKEN